MCPQGEGTAAAPQSSQRPSLENTKWKSQPLHQHQQHQQQQQQQQLQHLEEVLRAEQVERLQQHFEEVAVAAWGERPAQVLALPKERVRQRATNAQRSGADLQVYTVVRKHLLCSLCLHGLYCHSREEIASVEQCLSHPF